MGVLGRRSRVGDTADVTVARLRRGAHDVLEAVSDAAEDLGDRVGTQVTAVRRDLADRIDPDPVPRRGLRLLVLGLAVTTVSAVVWAVLSRRSASSVPHGAPEHLPSTDLGDADADADEMVAVEVVEIDVVDGADQFGDDQFGDDQFGDDQFGDEPAAPGPTGEPDSRSS